MSELIKAHVPCEHCGSHDAASIYTDHIYCFSCDTWTWLEERGTKMSHLHIIPNSEMEIKEIRARGITSDTCRKYGYFITKDDHGHPIQVANYQKDGKVIFQKTRDKDKNFIVRGHQEKIFWGQHLFSGGKKLVITEGEIDCLTVSQIQGNKYPVVSIPGGCKSTKETIKANIDWLSNFDEVILMLDMDDPGRQAVKEASGILPPHKLKVASLPLKDPNECLLAGRADEVVRSIWNAVEYRPDGILNAKDLKDEFFSDDASAVSYTFPWCDDLTNMTQGMRKGEMVLLTAGTGIGKSTMAREIAYKLKTQDSLKVGMVMLEENKNKTLRDLLSIHMKKPLHLLWNTIDKQAVMQAYEELYGDGNFCLYDHFGSIEGNNLLEKIRYLIVGEGCDFVIFDHVSIAVSGLDESSMNERKAIDILMTQLRSLVEETGAGLVVVSHLRKGDTKAVPFEQGGTISLDDLRGSGSLKQIPDTILAIERDQQAQEEDKKNLLKIRILKCRFTGNTGIAGYLRFNKSTNTLQEVDPLDIKEDKGDEKCPF